MLLVLFQFEIALLLNTATRKPFDDLMHADNVTAQLT
jgi:hypothetical protein